MTDEPQPLPLADREIDEAIERLFERNMNSTNPVPRGQMFSFENTKNDVPTLSSEPLMRLEQKMDAVISSITALRSRVDSIDTILARLIHRR
jgi:hypothetical protein